MWNIFDLWFTSARNPSLSPSLIQTCPEQIRKVILLGSGGQEEGDPCSPAPPEKSNIVQGFTSSKLSGEALPGLDCFKQ